MTTGIEAIALGALQGITEFLPISSDGHLVLVRSLFGLSDEGLGFDVALHLGTLLAVILSLRRDALRLTRAGVAALQERKLGDCPDRRIAAMLAVATIPAALTGAMLEDAVSGPLRDPFYAGLFLLVSGALLVLAEAAGPPRRGMSEGGLINALFVGAAQATAILPGLSRSGATFAAGRVTGLGRSDALRFLFLLAIPIIGGAVLYEGAKLVMESGASTFTSDYLIGATVAFLTGVVSLRFLLKFVQTSNLLPFAAYCGLAGTAGLVAGVAVL